MDWWYNLCVDHFWEVFYADIEIEYIMINDDVTEFVMVDDKAAIIKFIFSKKATKIGKIFIIDLTFAT